MDYEVGFSVSVMSFVHLKIASLNFVLSFCAVHCLRSLTACRYEYEASSCYFLVILLIVVVRSNLTSAARVVVPSSNLLAT